MNDYPTREQAEKEWGMPYGVLEQLEYMVSRIENELPEEEKKDWILNPHDNDWNWLVSYVDELRANTGVNCDDYSFTWYPDRSSQTYNQQDVHKKEYVRPHW